MSHRLATASLVFASFSLFSLVASPIPGVNEPHYLAKAKHYWNLEWCRGDLFLESTDAHVVFYETFGRLTYWLGLSQTAWVGRILGMLLLAGGWCLLVSRILPGRWSSLWTSWVFLLFVSLGNLSGEWIVGGIEAKVIAYGFVLLSLTLFIDRRWCPAAICCGLAISFHPIVGIWSLLAGGVGAALALPFNQKLQSKVANDRPLSGRGRWFLVATLLIVVSLPGIAPALQLLDGASNEMGFQANYIQVYYRLKHHLDPIQFSKASYWGYSLLLVCWLATSRWDQLVMFDRGRRVFVWYVAGTLVIALAGLAIGLGPKPEETMQYAFRLSLMKLYPFRNFDVMLPIAISLAIVAMVHRCLRLDQAEPDVRRSSMRRLATWLFFASILIAAISLSALRPHAIRMTASERNDWIDACRWISKHVPSGTVFFTPRNSWAFKWYANRGEYVSFKDCPQDARNIVEWNRRLRYLKRWGQDNFDNGYSAGSLRELRKQTGITHIITAFQRFGPFEAEKIYGNGTYKVFRLGE